jgi:hypothetical protein
LLDFAPFCGEGLNRSPASYQVDDQNDHGYYEQQMDQAAANVRKQANQPQDQQNYQNCPQHDLNLLLTLSSGTYQKHWWKEQRPCQRPIR